jgi:hypothetical protein
VPIIVQSGLGIKVLAGKTQIVDQGGIRVDRGCSKRIILGLPHGFAVLAKQGLAGPQMVVGEIVGGAAFHQGEWLAVEIDVFPQNRSIGRAFGDQPSLMVIKKDRGHNTSDKIQWQT